MKNAFKTRVYRYKYATIRACLRVLTAHLDDRINRLPPPHSSGRRIAALLASWNCLELQTIDGNACTVITDMGRDTLCGMLAVETEDLIHAQLALQSREHAAEKERLKIVASGHRGTVAVEENQALSA